MNAAEIRQMTPAERLRAIESLWDSLLVDQVEMHSPQWHEAILDERRRKIQDGTAKFLTMDELRATRNP
jgi:putative addiction module component (TIGR02574 family)